MKREFRKGIYFYRLSPMGAGSDKYGKCEVCQERVDSVFHQTEYRRVEVSLHSKTLQGLTMKHCHDYFGHQHCLESKRRGEGEAVELPKGSIQSMIENDNLDIMKTEILIDLGVIKMSDQPKISDMNGKQG